MRQIVLDTETTGLQANNGDRIVEIGCIEIINRRLTGNNFHTYLNPDRDSAPGALAVHGLTRDFLSDKPRFADIAERFCEYVQNSEIIIHNAPFDLAFLDAELARLQYTSFREQVQNIIDTLIEARALYPGKRNSLDALCERYQIAHHHRNLHGALLDAGLLAEVYLAMTRGQETLLMDLDFPKTDEANMVQTLSSSAQSLIVQTANSEELAAHDTYIEQLIKEQKTSVLWKRSE